MFPFLVVYKELFKYIFIIIITFISSSSFFLLLFSYSARLFDALQNLIGEENEQCGHAVHDYSDPDGCASDHGGVVGRGVTIEIRRKSSCSAVP